MIARRLVAEGLGTALLLVAIVGSGIVAATDGSASSPLLQHAVAVGAALAALIWTLGPISGAHLNPAVTLADALFRGLPWPLAGGYVAAQLTGAVVGVAVTNLTFDLPAVTLATTGRGGGSLVASEALATFGLLLVIFGMVRSGRTGAVPIAVGAYIASAILVTPSASFANPAVTVARMLSDTYTGIAPGGVAGFVAGQLAGTTAAVLAIRWLFDPDAAQAAEVVVPHDQTGVELATLTTGDRT